MSRKYEVVGIRPATDAEIAAKARLAELAAQQLTSVRTTAQNWRNSVGFGAVASTLVGLFTAADIVKNAPVKSLTDGAWLVGIGIIVAISSFSCALRSSFGWPSFVSLNSEDDLREWESHEAAKTISYLRWSMILAVVAFLIFCVGYAVLIFHVPLPFHFPQWQDR